jgi:DNA-binding NarL/FixJ family response regulator
MGSHQNLIPLPKAGGRHHALDMRAVVNAPFYIVDGGISQRALEVLRLLAADRSNRDIVEALYSLNTVATHVRNILTKTGTANRTEAAAYALRCGLLAE